LSKKNKREEKVNKKIKENKKKIRIMKIAGGVA